MMTSGPIRQFRSRLYLNVTLIACVGMVMSDRLIMAPLRLLKSRMS